MLVACCQAGMAVCKTRLVSGKLTLTAHMLYRTIKGSRKPLYFTLIGCREGTQWCCDKTGSVDVLQDTPHDWSADTDCMFDGQAVICCREEAFNGAVTILHAWCQAWLYHWLTAVKWKRPVRGKSLQVACVRGSGWRLWVTQ